MFIKEVLKRDVKYNIDNVLLEREGGRDFQFPFDNSCCLKIVVKA